MIVTQKQIAERLGVSRQLVGHALSGHPAVASETRERICALAQQLGYRANPLARALARKRTEILAVWLPGASAGYYGGVVQELSQLVYAAGFELVVSDPHLVPRSRSGVITTALPVDGILVVDAPWLASAYLQARGRSGPPCLTLGSYCSEETDSVRVDLFGASVKAVEQLISLGRSRIAHMTTVTTDQQPGEARRYGYTMAMKQAGLETGFIIADGLRSTAREVIREYVGQHGCPEGIFCHTDEMAIGAYRGLVDLGIRVPDDVALVGCDGIEDTEYLECPLSTIVPPVGKMCAKAWEFLQCRMEKPDVPEQRTVLQASLVTRQSTSPSQVTSNNQKGRVR